MTREAFDRQIQTLLDETLALGRLVEDAILESVASLISRDLEKARRIYNGDKYVNKKRFEIENDTLIAIATQAPMASDLRILASVIDVASELERIGDYAKGIALINIRMGNEPLLKPLIDIPRMAALTADMLHRALEAFYKGDVESARQIPKEDDMVDDLYNQVYRELLTFMIADPSTIDRATYLLWVSHNLERAADRVINICERTIFVETGEMVEIESSDDEIAID
ncbi:MAG: phosphate signaling complex protein PhoU [Anaerolineales bacterium]|nr:phosphate signaling complex protein PhoU [Anaerolineales bacterium]